MNIDLKNAVLKEQKALESDAPIASLVEILYKNGVSREFWCKEFTFNRSPSGSVSVTWVSVSAQTKPIFIGVDDISSVWVKDMCIISKIDYKNNPLALIAYKEFFDE